ncbi:unnamed protein product [Camellia sinensis]
MASMSIQYGIIRGTFTYPSIPVKHKAFSLDSANNILDLRFRSRGPEIRWIQKLSVSSATEAVEAETDTSTENPSSATPQDSVPTQQTEKPEVVVKTIEKPRLVLKFIWMEKNIGLGLDQVIPGHGTIPLSPYFFWPRKDAWEELKTTLEGKPWISQKKMIILLNQATDIINLWQQSGGNLS